MPVLSANLVRSSLLGNVFTIYASSKILSSSALVRLRFLWSVDAGVGVARGRLAGDMVVAVREWQGKGRATPIT